MHGGVQVISDKDSEAILNAFCVRRGFASCLKAGSAEGGPSRVERGRKELKKTEESK